MSEEQKEQNAVVKKKTGRPKGSKNRRPRPDHPKPIWSEEPILPQGYNGELISNLALLIDEPTFTDPECADKWDRFKTYLRMCAEKDMKVGNQMAYMAAGLSRKNASDWARCGVTDRVTLVNAIRQVCTVYREQLMADGKINPAVGIFWQKNYDGMRDQVENVVTANMPMGGEVTGRDAERLAATYLGNADGVLPPAENMSKCDD